MHHCNVTDALSTLLWMIMSLHKLVLASCQNYKYYTGDKEMKIAIIKYSKTT